MKKKKTSKKKSIKRKTKEKLLRSKISIREIKSKEPEDDLAQLVREEQFSEFMQPGVESTSPTLNQVAVAPQQGTFINLEQDIGTSPIKENNNGGEFKYLPNSSDNKEAKYIDSGMNSATAPGHVEMEKLGRENPLNITRESQFTQSEETKMESVNLEKYATPDKFETEKAGRQSPFEKREEKYKPSN